MKGFSLESPWTVPPSDGGSPEIRGSNTHMSWVDMVQEDELDRDLAVVVGSPAPFPTWNAGSHGKVVKGSEKQFSSRGHRDYLGFVNVWSKNDFICLERVNGKIVNIVEQRRTVKCVYKLQVVGRKRNM